MTKADNYLKEWIAEGFRGQEEALSEFRREMLDCIRHMRDDAKQQREQMQNNHIMNAAETMAVKQTLKKEMEDLRQERIEDVAPLKRDLAFLMKQYDRIVWGGGTLLTVVVALGGVVLWVFDLIPRVVHAVRTVAS
ncbi:hypothetical protein [Jiella pelagia]|uniref:DUF1640 domain-containing protein n=1 Tax=Jiella pelagia TaxID=2986949 RepID=A0ABY7C0Z8_9HYPH|nr:hypothetical protein [Jiella pelagia]WAP69030.1 hypothetical protein OH818_01450 [Jiella pelagia]